MEKDLEQVTNDIPAEDTDNKEIIIDESAPKKGSLIFKIVRYSVIGIATVVLCISLFNLLKISHEYKEGEKEYEKVMDDVFTSDSVPNFIISDSSGTSNGSVDSDNGYKFLNYNHKALLAKNEDALGYISLPAISTNLPIVHTDNNSFYLDHTITGTKNAAGCLFSDYRNSHSFDDANTLIYGHSMKNGTMFGMLNRYMKEDFYKTKENRYYYLYTEQGIYKYEIFAACVIPANSMIYTTSYDDETFASIQAQIKNKQLYDTGVSYTKDDTIMTLSTCIGDDSKRLVVLAKRLK